MLKIIKQTDRLKRFLDMEISDTELISSLNETIPPKYTKHIDTDRTFYHMVWASQDYIHYEYHKTLDKYRTKLKEFKSKPVLYKSNHDVIARLGRMENNLIGQYLEYLKLVGKVLDKARTLKY